MGDVVFLRPDVAITRKHARATTAEGALLISLKTQRLGNQRGLAEAVGIRGATLTHHLNAIEANGLLTRRTSPASR